MTKDVIGALRVTLGFDTSQFEHGSKRARDVASRDMAAIRKDVSAVRLGLEGLGEALLLREAVGAVRRALDFAASIKTVAGQVGVTKRELQEYRYAASQANVAQSDMDNSLKTLTKNMGEAKAGTKAQATVFRDLGVAIQDANGRVYSAGEVIPKLADALSRVKDPATRARIETKLFGEAGQKLDPLLTQGAKGVEELRRRAHELGQVMGDELVENADSANQKLSDLKQTLDLKFATAVAQNANAIVSLADALTKAAAASLDFATSYPRVTSALGGAAIGGRLGGVPGAVAGGIAGYAAADIIASGSDDANMDLAYRRRQALAARDRVRQLRNTDQSGEDYAAERGGGPARNVAAELRAAEREQMRQATLLWRAAQAARQRPGSASVVPDGALPVPNERVRKGPKDRTEELAQRYRDELARGQDDELGLRQDLITDLRHRAQIEHERIENAQTAYNTDVDSRVKQGELTEAQAKQLKLQNDRNIELQHSRVNWELDDALLEEENRVSRDSLDRARDMLQIRASLATTAKERRAVQLDMLDNELQAVRLAAEEVLARHDSTEAERQIARAKLDQLDSLRSGETLRINRDTMGPIETYLDSIPDTVDEINEAYENIAVGGLRSFNDGLAESASRILRVKGVAGDLFNQLIADVIRFQIQQASGGGGLLGGLFRLAGSALGLGGNPLAGSIDTAYGNAAGLAAGIEARNLSSWPSFASGGSMTVLGRRGIDRNVLSLNGLPIANVSYGERLSIANDNGGGQAAVARVMIVPSPYFDARVGQIAGGVAAPMAQQAAAAGSSGAQVAISRAGARRIP